MGARIWMLYVREKLFVIIIIITLKLPFNVPSSALRSIAISNLNYINRQWDRLASLYRLENWSSENSSKAPKRVLCVNT